MAVGDAMTEIRRLFCQVKNRLRSGKTRDDTEPLHPRTTKDEKQSETKESENNKMRRTPDLINSHSQATLPPIPLEHESRHGFIRGYPAVSGHIYEEISTSEDATISNSLHTNQSVERDRQNGRGGVFYISPIDGALHRLRPEAGNRIVCPHLHFDRGLVPPEVQRQASFTCQLFGKNLSVCRNCAKSLRERFISGEPDVIYPTYWRSFDLGKVSIPCPNLPEDLVYESQDGDMIPVGSSSDFCRERRHSVTAELFNGRRPAVGGNRGLRREKMATGSADDVAMLERLSCRATRCRLPEVEARLLGGRVSQGQRMNNEGWVANHMSMNNLLLSDVLRRNHDRQCLVW